METARAPAGFLGSLQSLGDSLLGTAHDRLRLFSLELQEEKYRLIQILLYTAGAVLAGAMALTFASLTLAFVFWEAARFAVLGGLAAFYALALLVLVVSFRHFLKKMPRPFDATIAELKEDRACIRPPS
ncbi:MAG: phage holin family protein [Opitutae bacterium]|nr:phage holin family protein [Opitutae bacterium]